MTNEFFPPTEEELEAMIAELKKQLEDEKYQDQWQELYRTLEERQNQLKNLTIINNAL